jgi:hypothetical protein
MNGIYLDEKSEINYRGITKKQMDSQFRGESTYTAEVDVHFPRLTVGQTLAYVIYHISPGLMIDLQLKLDHLLFHLVD